MFYKLYGYGKTLLSALNKLENMCWNNLNICQECCTVYTTNLTGPCPTETKNLPWSF